MPTEVAPVKQQLPSSPQLSKKAKKAADKAARKAVRQAAQEQANQAKLDVYSGVGLLCTLCRADSFVAGIRRQSGLLLQVTASVTLKPQLMVSLRDIQNLVLWVLGEGENPKWIFVRVGSLCSCCWHASWPPA